MSKGIGILVNEGYAYKIETLPETFSNGVLNMAGFKGDAGNDAYETWLAAGNTGTVDAFFASLAGLVVNDIRATYNVDKVGAEFINIYSGDALTSTQVWVIGTQKYTITYINRPDGNLESKTTTRNDGRWFTDTYEYDEEGVVFRVIPTEG
jgi:hypothetical protein